MRGGTDAQLVAEARQGSEKAFRRLVEKYHPVAYAVARGILGDRDELEDVVQEIFIKVYRGLHAFRGEAKLSSWIYRIARNEALNAAASPRPSFQPIDGMRLPAPESSRPDAGYGRRLERKRLETALALLEENYRVILELRYMAEKTYEEISETLNVPIGTVKTHIHRAKIELKRILSRKMSVEERRGS